MITNNYKDVHHESFNMNLFYLINIIRIMRNKISHNENITHEIDSLKKVMGEDDFYIIADDNNAYFSEILQKYRWRIRKR